MCACGFRGRKSTRNNCIIWNFHFYNKWRDQICSLLVQLTLAPMEDKNPSNSYGNLASTSLTYQIIGCCIICTSLDTSIPRMALLSPSKQCWNEETLSEQAEVYRAAQTSTSRLLGGGGKGGKRKAHRVSCPYTFVPPCISCKCLLSTCLQVIWWLNEEAWAQKF